jgi:hypothetical protein
MLSTVIHSPLGQALGQQAKRQPMHKAGEPLTR